MGSSPIIRFDRLSAFPYGWIVIAAIAVLAALCSLLLVRRREAPEPAIARS